MSGGANLREYRRSDLTGGRSVAKSLACSLVDRREVL
jgi:hypothetical protein